ncbi:MAG: L-histidine N(alpha)-methyltransferase [Bacteriovoracaceae bacterium]
MSYTILDSIKHSDQKSLIQEMALDVLIGFSQNEKRLNSKYFYDDKGSKIFSKIMECEDYYPTRSEFEILENHKERISSFFQDQDDINIIELGAGDGKKTKVLLRYFLEQNRSFDYHPIDISEQAIVDLTDSLNDELPKLSVHGVVGQYFPSLNWINNNKHGRNFIFFLGSNIGNFDLPQARVFLRTLWSCLNDGDLVLIGFDLKKDINKLLWAYNDREGLTSEFNINLLKRLNRDLGANFNLDNFQHFGTYNALKGAMESYLISLEDQSVEIDALKKSFSFKAFEPIHLEYSYKYLPKDIQGLADDTGFKIMDNLYDSNKYFVDSVWSVVKN